MGGVRAEAAMGPIHRQYTKQSKRSTASQLETHILTENNQIFATVPEIAENFAQTFQQGSSNDNYTQEFLRHKAIIEQEDINFDSDNVETYNRPFTVDEL